MLLGEVKEGVNSSSDLFVPQPHGPSAEWLSSAFIHPLTGSVYAYRMASEGRV